MSNQQKCSAEATEFVNELLNTYDVRIVLGVLGARFSEVAAAAIAGGIPTRFVSEVVAGTLEFAYTPSEHKPVVMYTDGKEILGRKQ